MSPLVRLLLLVIVAPAILLVRSGTADACSCMKPPPAEQAFEEADAVFVGQVSSIERSERELDVELAVSRAYKGIEAPTVSVQTPANSAACGYPFKDGTEYLVYAHAEKDGTRGVSLCSRTRPLERAEDDLAAIARITPGQAPDQGRSFADEAPRAMDEPPRADPDPGSPSSDQAPPQQVEPGTRGCGCSGSQPGPGALLVVLAAGAAWRRRRIA